MALVKKHLAAKEYSQIEYFTIRYEYGTERTVVSVFGGTFAPSPEDEESEIIRMESKNFTGLQWYMLARGLGEALYLDDLEFPMEDE